MNVKATLNKRRGIIMTVVNLLLITAVAYGVMVWIQGRKSL